MIECIQERDRKLKQVKHKLSMKMFNKPEENLNDHEQNELRIQMSRYK